MLRLRDEVSEYVELRKVMCRWAGSGSLATSPRLVTLLTSDRASYIVGTSIDAAGGIGKYL